MSLITDNIIPGNQGKTFGTNALEDEALQTIKENLLELDGVENVLLNLEIFPREFTIFTNKLISVIEIENRVKSVGFHAIIDELF